MVLGGPLGSRSDYGPPKRSASVAEKARGGAAVRVHAMRGYAASLGCNGEVGQPGEGRPRIRDW
jgi:hypothetical protein